MRQVRTVGAAVLAREVAEDDLTAIAAAQVGERGEQVLGGEARGVCVEGAAQVVVGVRRELQGALEVAGVVGAAAGGRVGGDQGNGRGRRRGEVAAREPQVDEVAGAEDGAELRVLGAQLARVDGEAAGEAVPGVLSPARWRTSSRTIGGRSVSTRRD